MKRKYFIKRNKDNKEDADKELLKKGMDVLEIENGLKSPDPKERLAARKKWWYKYG